MRFGIHIDQPTPPLGETLRQVKRCEKSGFSSMWMPDHILAPPANRYFIPDAFMTLALLASETRKITLGTAVTCPHRRNYAVLAHLVATLDHFSKGRAVLGIGSGESMNLDPFVIPWDRPVARTLEALALIKRLWKEEKPFTSRGEFYEIEDGFLQLDTIQKPHPPIFYAANGPLTLDLVGRYFDGWIPIMETPKTYKEHVALIAGGAEKEGRTVEDVERALILLSVICEDSDEAYNILKPARSAFITVPWKLARAGYSVPEGYSDYYYFHDVLTTREADEKYEHGGDYISEDIVRDFSVIGTVDECIDKIEMYQDSGLNHLIVFNCDTDWDRTTGFYEKEVIPYFNEGQK